VYLSSIRKERGYERSVESRPVGTILKPGETFRVEMRLWAFSTHTASFTFYGCSDESCGPSSPTTDKEWTAELSTLLVAGGVFVACEGRGFCSNDRGTNITWPPYGTWVNDIDRVGGVVNLLDTRAPS
jgi:hypothetical protein